MGPGAGDTVRAGATSVALEERNDLKPCNTFDGLCKLQQGDIGRHHTAFSHFNQWMICPKYYVLPTVAVSRRHVHPSGQVPKLFDFQE